MSNVINWLERDIVTRTWVEHTAQNQPELDVTYEVNNTELSGFTSLYNTGLDEGTTLPARGGSSNGAQHEYTSNAGYIWPYVFRRNTNNRHYFKTPSTLENKVVIRFNATPVLQLLTRFGGDRYTTDEQLLASDDAVIFITDTLEARIHSFTVRNDSTRSYYYLTDRIDPVTGDQIKYWDEESNGIFWLSCEVKVIDRISGNYKIIPLIARNLPYGYSDVYFPYIYVTFIVLNNFNPKYSYDNGEIYNTKVIQKYNDEYRYDNQEGQFIYPIFFMGSGHHTTTFYGNDYHVQAFRAFDQNEWSPYHNLLQDMFAHINVNNGFAINYAPDIHLHNDSAEPQQNVTVPGSTCVDNARDMYIDYYYVPVAYNNDSGSYEYYISGITLGEIPPEPDPEPDPTPEEYEGEPNVPELPEDPSEPTPTPPTPTPQDFLDAIKGYIDGKEGESNLAEEEERDSDIEHPYNGRTNINVVAQCGSNWNLIMGNLDTIADLKDRLLQVLGSDFDKALLLVDPSYQVENVINRIIQLPFTVTYLRDQLVNMYGNSIVSGCPCHNEIPLCSDLGFVNGDQDISAKEAYASLVANRLGNTAAELTFQSGTWTGIKAWFNLIAGVVNPIQGTINVATHFSPITRTAVTYPIVRYRFVPIDYGEVTFDKIFGNALDYTEVNYTLELPTGIKIALDPQLLFRNSTDGSEADSVVLHVIGMLDLETGDILITVTANNDMIIQTTINVAMERSIYGKDQTQALRNIGTSIMDMVRISAGMLPSMNYSSSDVGSKTHSFGESYNAGISDSSHSSNGWNKASYSGSHKLDPLTTTHFREEEGGQMAFFQTTDNDRWSPSNTAKAYSISEAGGDSHQSSTSSASNYEKHASNTASNSKVMNRGLSAGPVIDIMKGATESLARSATGVPYVNLSSAQPGGAVRLLANQLPILHYDYPEIITPRIVQSYYGPWDYEYKYEEEYGLNALTTKVGRGFNRYMSVTNIDMRWTYSWSHEELSGFTSSLLHGFYVYDEDNIYPKPSVWSSMFAEKYIYDEETGEPTEDTVSLYPETTEYITLLNIFSDYERYVDRLLLGSTSTQGGNINYCYRCNIYKTENIDTPVIEVDQSIYTHQNTALWCGRVYHVVGVDYLPGHIVRLYLEEDYLTTWYYLTIVKGIIDRSTSYPINNLHNEFPKTVRRIYKKIIFDDLQDKLGVAVVAATPNPCATKEDLEDKGYDIAIDWVDANRYT